MAQRERLQVEEQYKWDLTPLYESKEDWAAEKRQLASEIADSRGFKGSLASSPDTLLDFLSKDADNERRMARLSIYASLLSDQDIRVPEHLAMVKEIEQLSVDYSQMTGFARPELTAINDEKWEEFFNLEPQLSQFKMTIDRIRRQREHTLSDAEEVLLSKVAILGNPSSDTFSVFSDAEMPMPSLTLADGSNVELDHATFANVRCSPCRDDRKAAFDAFWANYAKFEGTFGELMNGNLKRMFFNANVRKYGSCLEAALSRNDIPTAVYHSLIDNVNENLPTFHRYLRLKARLLGVEQLHYYDLYAPAVEDVDLEFSFAEARQLVLDALAPLGDEYLSVVRRAFDERWIDAMPNQGKASGAYSNGAAYDVHPYILMNFDGRYDSVGTLIHELGHTMQSYYSNLRQPFALADYSIFVAEVASTFNEALLDHMMLSRLKESRQKISLLMSMLDGFKGTLFRQAQFAEFQLRASQMVENGEPITGRALSLLYGEITRKYYGQDGGVCVVDDPVNIEWAFIPHFYMGFYVYQYSTSFVASQALSESVLRADEGALGRYLEFLAAGDSKYPIEELRDAGVDMLSPLPFDMAIKKMNALMDQVEALL